MNDDDSVDSISSDQRLAARQISSIYVYIGTDTDIDVVELRAS